MVRFPVGSSLVSNVADPGCLSGILIFYPSRIPDLGSRIQKQQQKRGVKKISCYTFFCSHKFHKIEYYFIFYKLKIRKKPIPDPGSQIQGSKRHRIPDPDPQHWWSGCLLGRPVDSRDVRLLLGSSGRQQGGQVACRVFRKAP